MRQDVRDFCRKNYGEPTTTWEERNRQPERISTMTTTTKQRRTAQAQDKLELIVAAVMNELEHGYGITELVDYGMPTVAEIARKLTPKFAKRDKRLTLNSLTQWLLNAGDFPIAKIWDKDRARLIVRAVNNHDKLVGALQRLTNTGAGSLNLRDYQEWVQDVARAVLAELGE